MSHLSEVYESQKHYEQRLMDNLSNRNNETEKLLQSMEKQVKSDKWEELKHG